MKDMTTLLRSQCEALRNLPPEQFKAAVTAIWDYEMDDTQPEDPVAAMAVGMVKPLIDKRNKRTEAGRKGGSKPKQTEANPKQNQANPKQIEANGSKPEANGSKREAKEERRNKKEEIKNIKDIKDRHFVPPTPQDVQAYIDEKGYRIDAERFVDFYKSKGWMVGKSPMRDWKATVRNWARSQRKETTAEGNFTHSGTDWDELAYQIMEGGT